MTTLDKLQHKQHTDELVSLFDDLLQFLLLFVDINSKSTIILLLASELFVTSFGYHELIANPSDSVNPTSNMTSDVSHTLKPAGPPSFSTSDDLQARSIPSSIDSTSVLSEYLDRLQKSLANPSVESLQNVLFTDGFWRDHLFLTWDLRTLRGIDKVSEYLSSSKKTASITFSAPEKANYKRQPLLNTDDALNPMLTAYIDVESEEGIGEGVVRLLVDKDGVWKVSSSLYLFVICSE